MKINFETLFLIVNFSLKRLVALDLFKRLRKLVGA